MAENIYLRELNNLVENKFYKNKDVYNLFVFILYLKNSYIYYKYIIGRSHK